jgi:hypothetical protein
MAITLVAKLALLDGLAAGCGRWLMSSCCWAGVTLGPAMSLGRQVMEWKSRRCLDDEQLIRVRRVGKDTSENCAAGTAASCLRQLKILGAACMNRA